MAPVEPAQQRIPARLDVEIWPGTIGPLQETPPRRAGSVRRTTSVQSTWPDGFAGPLVAVCTGRDLVTDSAGGVVPIAEAAFRITTAAASRVVAAVDDARLADLVDANLAGGFRKAAAGLTAVEPGSVPALLLDDAPAAVFVSASSPLRADIEQTGTMPVGTSRMVMPVVCVGRAGPAMSGARATGRPLLGQGPPAGRLERDDDPFAWHEEPPLPVLAMRRRRRIDVWQEDDVVRVDSYFRDSRLDPDGTETSVHEYDVEVVATSGALRIAEITVRARTLPGPDCPGAVASAQDVVGTTLPELRATVRQRLRDSHSCTHLDDQLRALADAPFLLGELAGTPDRGRS